ncbi:C-8 sterol isomerase [Ascodesmis nigricans]|uniref:C-8 sterol isomerase n=1 Tax=Ascodesmis nigricans TaxID=341454 RepID=A0A4S2N815_9PEZI|nr:C-8 sterol isomerase [Ascodesmis nigricans]
MRFLTFLLVVPVILYCLDALLPRAYIFDPARLQELSKESIAAANGNTTVLFEHLTDSLRKEYGEKHINKLDKDAWFFNNAGGAMGAMIILHASLTEYLILFGTPLGTEGHSGVHLAHDYFTILEGQQKRLIAGNHTADIYNPGDQNWLPRGWNSQYQLEGWALELAQGWIPSMLVFGFLDTFSSTLDIGNLWKTIWLTAKDMIGQLLVGKI